MTRKDGLRVLAVCLVLGLGTIALYSPAFGFNFVSFDDGISVANNPHLGKGVCGWAFSSGYGDVWQPLTWLSHAVDCAIYGLKPGGHHATNLILHAFNAVLVFLVLRQLTGALWRSAAVAALFAWHPLHVETFAWISERKGLLGAFFWLLSLWAYARYAENAKARLANAKLFYMGAVILFAFAVMSNLAAATLPFVLLLLDWWPLGRFAATEERPAGKQALFILAEKVPLFILAIAAGIVTVKATASLHVSEQIAELPYRIRFVTAGMSYFHYLAKSIWPTDLAASYPFVLHWQKWQLIGVGMMLVGITIVAVLLRKTRPFWLTGWLWFIITLAPVLNLVQAGSQPMADRYMYIPSIGLWMLFCWEAYDLAATWRLPGAAMAGISAVLLAACCVLSSIQLRCWKDPGTLLARIPDSATNARGHADYADYLFHMNRFKEAEAEAEKAHEIAPDRPPIMVLLGEIYLREHKFDQSLESLQSALRLDNTSDVARIAIGQVFLGKGRPADAAEEFKVVIQHDPKNLTALNDLAWLLATDPHPEIRRGAIAVQLADHACELTKGQEPVLLGTLAAAYAETGDFDKAVKVGEKAQELALARGLKSLAQSNLQFVALYRAHKPFHEKN